MPDFNIRPKTRDVQGIELGDVQGKTIQDINPSAPNRDQITVTKPIKEE